MVVRVTARPQTADLPLFATTRRPTLAERYHAWRLSPRGQDFFRDLSEIIRTRAAVTSGRIEVNLAWAQLRAVRRPSPQYPKGYGADNSHRSFAARELLDRYPELAGRIEIRHLKGEP